MRNLSIIGRIFTHRTIRVGKKTTSFHNGFKNLKVSVEGNKSFGNSTPFTAIQKSGSKSFPGRAQILIPSNQESYDRFFSEVLPKIKEQGWELRKPLSNWLNKWINI